LWAPKIRFVIETLIFVAVYFLLLRDKLKNWPLKISSGHAPGLGVVKPAPGLVSSRQVVGIHGYDFLAESDQNTLKVGIHSIPA